MELVAAMLNVGIFALIALWALRAFGWISDFIRA